MIIDTTVWIDYLRGLRNKETPPEFSGGLRIETTCRLIQKQHAWPVQ